MTNEFLIKFGGENHIKVETLTEFLEKYAFLLYRINENLGHSEDDLIIQVSPPEKGSFKIRISPKYENQLLNTMSGVVAGTLSGLIVAWTLNTNQPSIEDIASIIKELNTVDQKEVTQQVYNTYNQIDVKQTINRTFQIVSQDINVKSLDISQNDKPIIEIPKEKFNDFIKPESDFEIVNDSDFEDKFEIDKVSIIIKTVHFEGNAKWAFIWKGYPIKATIKDENFLNKLNKEPFRKGDILKVELRKRKYYNDDLKTYLVDQNSYEIVKVIEHNSPNENYKLSLNE